MKRGLTIIEVLLAVGAGSVIVIALTAFVGRSITINRTQLEQDKVTEDARIQLERITEIIRNATRLDCNDDGDTGDVGEGWLVAADDYDITVKSNVDADSEIEQVRFFVAEDSTDLVREVIQPGVTICDFTGTADATVLARSIRNRLENQPIFNYSEDENTGSSNEPDASLLHHWPLDESSGTTSRDLVGDNHGTWQGTPVPSGDVPANLAGTSTGSLGFEGSFSGDYVTLDSNFDFSGMDELTFSMWVKSINYNSHGQLLGEPTGATSSGVSIFLQNSTGEILFCAPGALQGAPCFIGAQSLRIGEWDHVVATFDNTDKAKIYINGLLDAEWDVTGAQTGGGSTGQGQVIARSGQNDRNILHGSLDDMRVYNRALSAENVAELYAGNEASGGDEGGEGGNLACADGTAEDTFQNGLTGCAGIETFDNRANLCASGYRLATAQEWVDNRGGVDPSYIYWTSQRLYYQGSGSGSCSVHVNPTFDCAASTSMAVCSGNSDALGNTCSWINCGLELQSPNEKFGGCVNSSAAGALCIPV